MVALMAMGFASAWWFWRDARLQLAQSTLMAARFDDVSRRLSLAADELRRISLAVHGGMAKRDHTALVARLLRLAEDMVFDPGLAAKPRYLRQEEVRLGPAVALAIAQTQAALGPARRVFQVAPRVASAVLRADRRAVHQVLLGVLGSAAVATGEGDTIALDLSHDRDQVALIVEDEGTGLSVPEDGFGGNASRGVGMGIALAKVLVGAHGGALEVESAAQVGTRVRISFPATALVAG